MFHRRAGPERDSVADTEHGVVQTHRSDIAHEPGAIGLDHWDWKNQNPSRSCGLFTLTSAVVESGPGPEADVARPVQNTRCVTGEATVCDATVKPSSDTVVGLAGNWLVKASAGPSARPASRPVSVGR